jgi:hypothetical protein
MHGAQPDVLDLLLQLVRHEGHSSLPITELAPYLVLQFSRYACIFKHLQERCFDDFEHLALFVGVVEVGEFFLEGQGSRGLCDCGDGSGDFLVGAEEVLDDTEETDDAEEDEHLADLAREGLTEWNSDIPLGFGGQHGLFELVVL